MPTIFSHPVVAVGLSALTGFRERRKYIIITAMLLTILPDIDVVGFRLGIPYLHFFGHRGFTHSLFFAALSSLLAAGLVTRNSSLSLKVTWLYFFLCAASHGILDAFTDGGHGIAFFSPFSNERFFFAIRPIDVSPLSIQRFFSGRGYTVIISEMLWIWVPFCSVFLVGIVGKISLNFLKNTK